jgi:hypothetical protein
LFVLAASHDGYSTRHLSRCVVEGLRAASPVDAAVEGVARDCGFRHYQELFGELPSVTLAGPADDR